MALSGFQGSAAGQRQRLNEMQARYNASASGQSANTSILNRGRTADMLHTLEALRGAMGKGGFGGLFGGFDSGGGGVPGISQPGGPDSGFNFGGGGAGNFGGGTLGDVEQVLGENFGGAGAYGGSGGASGSGYGGLDSFQSFIDAQRTAGSARIGQQSKDLLGSSLGSLSARGLGSSNLRAVAQGMTERFRGDQTRSLNEDLLGQQSKFDERVYGRKQSENAMLQQFIQSLMGSSRR